MVVEYPEPEPWFAAEDLPPCACPPEDITHGEECPRGRAIRRLSGEAITGVLRDRRGRHRQAGSRSEIVDRPKRRSN
jgi:hypothetical protein